MELEKLSKEEFKVLSVAQASELELGIRQELVKLRMDIYAEKGKHTGRIRKLKRNLARALTIKNDKKAK